LASNKWTPPLLSLTRGQHEVRFLWFFLACFCLPKYNNNSYTRESSIKILQSWSNWSVDYIYVSLENISLIWTYHHCRWRAVKLGLCLELRTSEQGGGSKSSLSCHTCFNTGPRSHPQHDAIPLCVVRGDWMEWGGPSDETGKTARPRVTAGVAR
jgi:hypothetical protein